MRFHFILDLHSIKYKYLFATFALFSVFAFATGSVWYTNLTNEAKVQTMDNISSIVQNSNNSFESYMKDIDNVAALLTTHSSNYLTTSMINLLSSDNSMSEKQLYQSRLEASDFLISLCSFKKYLYGLTVADLSGNTMTYGVTTSYTQMKKMAWYQQVTMLTHNGPVFISPYYVDADKNENSKVFSIARPVLQGNTEIGFILAEINCSVLNDTFNAKGLDGMSIVVTDQNSKQFVYKSTGTPNAFNTDTLTQISSKINARDGSFYATIGKTNDLVVYHKSPFTSWTTIGIIPESVIMNSFMQTRNKVVLISLLFVIGAAFAIYLLASLLTKNLLKLSHALTKLDKDNLNIAVQINSKDEIAQIYKQFNLMVIRINQLITDNKFFERKKRITEMQALQSQITPHFLYNTLNTIKYLAAFQGIDNIQTVSADLSNLLHVSMDGRSFIHIREELDLINSYLDIQRYRYCNKFSFEIDADKELLPFMIPKFFLQPIVENSLLHGIAPLQHSGILVIQLFRSSESLKIRIKDNGVGMSEKQIAQILSGEETRIGINNVLSRIKMYFGAPYGLTINSERGLYTTVDITIPIINESEVEKYE